MAKLSLTFLFYFTFEVRRLINEIRILKSTAHQKLSTVNPGTIIPTNKINKALIIIRNRPNEIIVIGRVRRTSKGLSNTFKIPKTNATSSAVKKFSTWTPGKTYAAITITKALTNQLIRIDIQVV